LVGPILEQFEESSGINLETKYGDSAELATLLLEEGDRSPADLFLAQDAGALGAVSKEGLFLTMPDELLQKVRDDLHSTRGEWVGITGRVRTVVYNTSALKESDLPSSILDYNDPKWSGKIGWAPTNGSFQSFVTALRKMKGEGVARSWLEGINQNGAKSYENNSAIVKAVGAGEIQIGFVNHYYLVKISQEDNGIAAANYFFKNGDPGGLINVSGAGILKSSKAQKTAARLLEFLLSQEGQEFFAKAEFEYPVIGGVAPSPLLPPLSALPAPALDLSDLDDLKGTLKMLQEAGLV
jgi:iron(III) transport system substrate-binding protein